MVFAKQLLTAATISLLLSAAGCSDSSTDSGAAPATTNDGNTSSGGGSTSDSGTGDTGGDGTGTTDNTDNTSGDGSGTDDDTGNSSGGDTGSGSGGSDDNTDTAGGSASGSGTDGDTGTVDPVACQSTTHLGQPFQTSQGSDSDPVFHSALAADGCLDASSVWSGDSGDVLVLDTGTAQPMQGIYVWPRYNQLNWLEVSTSTDGTNWTTEWQAIPTRPVQGPQYLSFKQPRSLRWVRLKGLKGGLNSWVNISEVRWSLTGENVIVPKALRYKGGPDMSANRAAKLDLSSWSTHSRLNITESITQTNMRNENCAFLNTDTPEQSPLYVWVDLYGQQDTAYKRTDLPGGIIAFSYDWSHHQYPEDYNIDLGIYYGRSATPKDGSTYAATRVMHDQFYSWYDINFPDGPPEQQFSPAFCLGTSGHGDLWYGPPIAWYELLEGNSAPVFSDFR